MNSIFLDGLEADLERLERINRTLSLIPEQASEENGVKLRSVESLVISPSQDLQAIAHKHVHRLPWTIRFLLKGVGALNNTRSSIVSYLLFEKEFCRELISLGYQDAMARQDELTAFLGLQPEQT